MEQEAIFKWSHYLSGQAVFSSLVPLFRFWSAIPYASTLASVSPRLPPPLLTTTFLLWMRTRRGDCDQVLLASLSPLNPGHLAPSQGIHDRSEVHFGIHIWGSG